MTQQTVHNMSKARRALYIIGVEKREWSNKEWLLACTEWKCDQVGARGVSLVLVVLKEVVDSSSGTFFVSSV